MFANALNVCDGPATSDARRCRGSSHGHAVNRSLAAGLFLLILMKSHSSGTNVVVLLHVGHGGVDLYGQEGFLLRAKRTF